jgi:hypothetical protein
MKRAEKAFKELLKLFNKHNVKYCIGLKELIKNKSATKRKQDEIDLEILLSFKKNGNRIN